MRIYKGETEQLREYASMFLHFDYDDPDVQTWITMPEVLAVRWSDGSIDYYYAMGQQSVRGCAYRGNERGFARELGERLKYWIRWKGYYQNELAEKIGINPIVLNRYVNGVNIPSAYILYRLAEALDISLDDLVVFDHDINEYVE